MTPSLASTPPTTTPATRIDPRIASLRRHATIFAVVIVALVGIDVYTAEPYWAHWVFLGWGTGLAFHAWTALRR